MGVNDATKFGEEIDNLAYKPPNFAAFGPQ